MVAISCKYVILLYSCYQFQFTYWLDLAGIKAYFESKRVIKMKTRDPSRINKQAKTQRKIHASLLYSTILLCKCMYQKQLFRQNKSFTKLPIFYRFMKFSYLSSQIKWWSIFYDFPKKLKGLSLITNLTCFRIVSRLLVLPLLV